MSWKLVGEVWTLAMRGAKREVLSVLAWHARDEDRRARPGLALLAWKTGQNERTVRRQLEVLERSGVIEAVAYPKGGRGMATEYRLHLDHWQRKPPPVYENEDTQMSTFPPQNVDTQMSTFLRPKRGQNSPETWTDPRETWTDSPETWTRPSSNLQTNKRKQREQREQVARARATAQTNEEDEETTKPTAPPEPYEMQCPSGPHTFTYKDGSSYGAHLESDPRHKVQRPPSRRERAREEATL